MLKQQKTPSKIMLQNQKENQFQSKVIVVKNFSTKFFKVFQMRIIINSNKEIVHMVLILSTVSIVLSGIFLKHLFLKKGESNCFDVLPTITKQYINRINSLTSLTPIQASLKKIERFVYNILLDKRKKLKPNFQVIDLVRTAVLNETFLKLDSTNWSYKIYKITEKINHTIPSYKIGNLKERYNEALLKKAELTMKKSDSVMEILGLN